MRRISGVCVSNGIGGQPGGRVWEVLKIQTDSIDAAASGNMAAEAAAEAAEAAPPAAAVAPVVAVAAVAVVLTRQSASAIQLSANGLQQAAAWTGLRL